MALGFVFDFQLSFLKTFKDIKRISLMVQNVKHLPQCGRPRFNPWVGKIPWRRKWQPTTVLLPGKSRGRRSLVDCSPWGRKESDTTERLYFQGL